MKKKGGGMENERAGLFSALNDFRRARRKANLRKLTARIQGKQRELLSFEKVKQEAKVTGLYKRYLDDIPVGAIIGSVGRYQDFDDQFLPLDDSDAGRWARVKLAQETEGLPPIEVYKISDVYFVLDGHHRVSIARDLAMDTIEAYVNPMRANIEISPEDDYDDIILKAERADFLAKTRLGEIFPDMEFSVTLPGRYKKLFEHILVHQYYLGLERERDIPLEEAVRSWVKNVYRPAVTGIDSSGLLRAFAGRTQADMYLWIKDNGDVLLKNIQPQSWEQSLVKMVENLFGRGE